jgi:hypothetical protein
MKRSNRGCFLCLVIIGASWPAGGQGVESVYTREGTYVPDTQRLAFTLPRLTSGRNKAVTGMVLYSAAVVYEWAVAFPRSMKLNNRLMSADSVSTKDAEEALFLVLIALPGGIVKLIGGLVSCSGGNSVYTNTKLLLDPQVSNPKIWTPYIAGWLFSGLGSVVGFAAGQGKNRSLLNVSIACSAIADLAWGYSVVNSVIYSNRQINRYYHSNVSVSPVLSNGRLSGMCLEFGF